MKDKSAIYSLIHYIGAAFEEMDVSYSFIDSAALWIQGVKLERPFEVKLQFQWDGMDTVYQRFLVHQPSPLEKDAIRGKFHFDWNGIQVTMECPFNITVRTNPYRIKVVHEGAELWCFSLYTYLYSDMPEECKKAIHTYLLEKQHSVTSQNEEAWNQNQYNTLVNRYGEPEELAAKIKKNPDWRLYPFRKYLGDVKKQKVVHLLGSNGIKAIALSLLGANVTVVDFSKENERYAIELAKHANVAIAYVVADIFEAAKKDEMQQEFEVVLMELGVLHYFLDLKPLFDTVEQLLRQGGNFILHEFHPISTKLITSSGKKHKVTGNYFDPAIVENQVAFSKHVDEEQKQTLPTVLHRKWTLGEVITSAAQAGLTIEILEEEPNHKSHDIGLPKTFTLVASKK
ncbi:methyltransferase family protein [Bacillus oleivorans]|uniref:Methyltransferase family protein n=1 Tax=Bacillus oleivorans TaxID=1448271 RepID=A0A285CH86_9BACI|nr:methyltransferase domain-containing protein [Bacillus oleivorans]SNX66870.1 methyltransferase family protein [Bacillus oleivorans]